MSQVREFRDSSILSLNCSRGEPIMKIKYALNQIRALCVLLLVVISLAFPALAFASDEHGCTHESTVQSLHHCVVHAAEAGHIDDPGVTTSLLAKLDAAQAALDRGQTEVAVNILQAFIQDVEAQAGKHIVTEHAEHLVTHTTEVITALSE